MAADPLALFDDELPPLEPRTRPRRSRGQVPSTRPRALTFPVIAILSGVGLAYIAQTAHETASRYQAAQLQADQISLIQENNQLADEVARAGAASQIEIAAQKLGMKPAAKWSYVGAVGAPIAFIQEGGPLTSSYTNDPLQDLVAMLNGSFGTTNAQAATP